ncbi:MAG: DNA topoisomerase IV subunit B [Alphaproteobacteria bacterium]|nr:DNA topoisomerase IV subunit B [Alphaproteobacteria bacterium]
MSDLFASKNQTAATSYTADDIEVLEGLEPVRRRPGMYIGGTDETAMHHLVNEIFDNAMDEAVAGFATRIELEMREDNVIVVRDNGRGIPIDPHPKFPKKSALEVILTMLHSGGKFGGKVYDTSGGLHGVGISVVNALSDYLVVEVIRDKTVYQQSYCRGEPTSKIEKIGQDARGKGTTVAFRPDHEIFGKAQFKPEKLYKLARSKGYLYRGVEIRWKCAPSLLSEGSDVPAESTIHFPGGLGDFLTQHLEGRPTYSSSAFCGEAELAGKMGRLEWAVAWPTDEETYVSTYCNTIPTPDGGTHESGLRTALTKGFKAYAELANNKKAVGAMGEDMLGGAVIILSLFLRDPQFQGQTKNKLVNVEAARLVENAVRDHFDHFLTGDPETSKTLLNMIVERMDERLRRRADKEVSRKAVTQKLRLPGKLADCTRSTNKGTELFIVEGDSAGGSAKQARMRETQAVLPLRGKILNVASATTDKIKANQELADLVLAMGCGSGRGYSAEALRYEKIIIMTDADVDGAHIASLLMTFFYQEMPEIIRNGHLFIARPPLYRVTIGTNTFYAQDDKDKEQILAKHARANSKIDIGRFKGLGEMMPAQLKETTMTPGNRILLKVMIQDEDIDSTRERVEQLMGKKPELRFAFIQEQTQARGGEILEKLDV